ncbi:MAG: DUF2520 domain-containing protein, partial [Acidimicrobiia bacterium]|nr:DUF2520 domain-containing protein [Acidimicrobiia bacterium]
MTVSGVPFALIGPGRAGRSLLGALEETRWVCRAVYGRGDDVAAAAHGVDAVVLAVPDDAIATVARAIEPRSTAVIIHLSGAKTLEVLDPHLRRASVHPLVSLPDPVTGAARLSDKAAFALSGDPLAWDLVETLGGRWFEVEESSRTLYHATASIAANHLVALCAQVSRLADRLGLTFDLYGELMTATLENVCRVGPADALTGPAARGDIETVLAHLDELLGLDRREADLYAGWATEAARLGARMTAEQL